MSVLSKYFEQAMIDVGCQEILHPGRSCLSFNGTNFLGSIRSNATFFLPIALLRLLMLAYHRKTLSWVILRQAIGEFGAMMVNALLVANCWTGTFCLATRMTGRIYDNYSVSLAPLLGTFAMLLMPTYVKTTHAKAIFVANLECWIKSRPSRLLATMRKSRTVGTFCFMLVSAGITQLVSNMNRQAEFWFITPLKPLARQDRETCCLHTVQDSCTRYILKGLQTYLTFSTTLELARRIIVTFSQLRLSRTEQLKSLLRLRYRLILFLTLYNSTYRMVTCLLARARRKAANEDNIAAAFACGIWYALYPNYNIFNLAVSTFCQVAWSSTMERYTNHPVAQMLDKLPCAPFVWSVSMCYVIYSRAYYPWAMSRFAHKFIDLCSNYASRTASENFARRFLVEC